MAAQTKRMTRRTPTLVVLAIALLTVTTATPAAPSRDELDQRLVKLERTVDSRGLVDLLQQLQFLQGEVKRLRGQIEEQQHVIATLRQTQREAYADLDSRLATVESGAVATTEPGAPPLTILSPQDPGPVAGEPGDGPALQLGGPAADPGSTSMPMAAASAAAPAAAATAAPAAVATAPSPPGVSGGILNEPVTMDSPESEAAYREAFGLLKSGEYEASIEAFNAFLGNYPRSRYADNVQYWIGEAYYVQRDYALAMAEYRKLLTTYPASKKQSHAMLKIGYCLDELDQPVQARAVLQDLKARFPGTQAQRLADERIQRILAASAGPQ